MAARLECDRCGAGLVPAVNGLRCPRFSACGRGGPDESAERVRDDPGVAADGTDTSPAVA